MPVRSCFVFLAESKQYDRSGDDKVFIFLSRPDYSVYLSSRLKAKKQTKKITSFSHDLNSTWSSSYSKSVTAVQYDVKVSAALQHGAITSQLVSPVASVCTPLSTGFHGNWSASGEANEHLIQQWRRISDVNVNLQFPCEEETQYLCGEVDEVWRVW